MIRQRSLILYLLFSLLTCGIYSIYFWYCYTVDVNKMCAGDGQESPNYFVVLLLSILTFGIYGLYWFYKQANRLRAVAPRYGVVISDGGDTFLLWFIIGTFLCAIGSLFSYNVLISNANIIANVYNGQAPTPAPVNWVEQQPKIKNCYCSKCGASIYVSDKFCKSCGEQNASGGSIGRRIDLDKVTSLSINIKGAVISFLFAAILIFKGFLVFIGIDMQQAYGSGFTVILYMIPAICMIVFGVLCYLDKEEYRMYEIIPLIVFLGLTALECTKIPLARGYGLSLIEAWKYNSWIINLLDMITLAAALAGVVLLCLEFAKIRNDMVLAVLGCVILGTSVIQVVILLFSMLKDLRYMGTYIISYMFGMVVIIVKAAPLLLYVVKRNPDFITNMLRKK